MTKSNDLPDAELLASVKASCPTKSAQIRALDAAGWPCAKIHKALDIRYQHARNVLVADKKRQSAVSSKPYGIPKASEIASTANYDFQFLAGVLTNALHGIKKSVNLSIDSGMLEFAKGQNINLSEMLESSLVTRLRHEARLRWQAENREAIEASNRFFERHGLWSDGLRQF